MQSITADQSRSARRELGLSQANVAESTGLNRQYISEFESGHSSRLTKAQLRKLQAFYESSIEEANENGEAIEIAFGDMASNTPVFSVETLPAKQFLFPVGKDVPEEVIKSTLATISTVDKKLTDLLTKVAQREQALFGPGEFNEETLASFRESFSLLACNYLLIRAIGGWPEICQK
jgi:transcriptional regulator with XRE-family HTH domain